MAKRDKYNAKKVTFDGITFDSRKEGLYYLFLKQEEREGRISNLRMQVPYVLLPEITGTRIVHLKTKDKEETYPIQQAVRYLADFVYTDNKTGEELVVDVKSEATRKKDAYILKKKMMRSLKGIVIKEVIL